MIVENGEELVYGGSSRHDSAPFRRRFSFCYAFMMAGSGLQLPFLPLWLAGKGLGTQEIALVLGAMTGCRMVSVPLIANIADIYRNRRLLLRVFGFASAGGYLLLAQAEGFWPILGCAVLASIFFAPIFPLAEGFSSEASAALGVQYGRIRLWASLSFLGGSLLGGLLLTLLPIASVAYLIAAAQALSALVLLTLPSDPASNALPPREGSLPRGGLRPLMTGSFGLIILAASLGQGSHAMLYSFGSLLWERAGQSEFAIGSFWAVAVTTEVLMLYNGKAIVERFGALNLMVAGTAGGILRWLLMVPDGSFVYWARCRRCTGFPSPRCISPPCNACFCTCRAPPAIWRRESIHPVPAGLAMTLMTWLAGALFDHIGNLTFLVMTLVSLLALGAAVMLRRTTAIRVHLNADKLL